MSATYAIGYDFGSESGRAVLVDVRDGREVAQAVHAYPHAVMDQRLPDGTKLGHDWAGYFMMPLALGFLWLELQILERLTVPVNAAQFKPVGGRTAAIPVR